MDDGPVGELRSEAACTKTELIRLRDAATGHSKRVLKRAVHRIDKLETALRRISAQALTSVE